MKRAALLHVKFTAQAQLSELVLRFLLRSFFFLDCPSLKEQDRKIITAFYLKVSGFSVATSLLLNKYVRKNMKFHFTGIFQECMYFKHASI